MKKTVLVFGALIVALLALFQLSKYTIAAGNLGIELVIAGIAVIFFVIGVYLNKKSLHKKIPSPPEQVIDEKKITQLGISNREYQILVKISEGWSNKEIAQQLFVSESTIKTHISNLF
ncbi:MAG: LuxR C-terminal-related transcriptional regulator, partial [Bacteroidota bacterium]